MSNENVLVAEAIEPTPLTPEQLERQRLDNEREEQFHSLQKQLLELAKSSNIVSHAQHELDLLYKDSDDDMGKDDVLAIVAHFALQGHSGGSAGWSTSVITRLLRFQPLRPLTGEDDEWVDVCDDFYQNKRAGNIFKDKSDGVAYISDGYVFRDHTGSCFTGQGSRKTIQFPYSVTDPEYIDSYYDVDDLAEEYNAAAPIAEGTPREELEVKAYVFFDEPTFMRESHPALHVRSLFGFTNDRPVYQNEKFDSTGILYTNGTRVVLRQK